MNGDGSIPAAKYVVPQRLVTGIGAAEGMGTSRDELGVAVGVSTEFEVGGGPVD